MRVSIREDVTGGYVESNHCRYYRAMQYLRNALKHFHVYQKKAPILMMSAQAGTLMGIGDIIAQSLDKKTDFDPKRFFTFAGIGLVLVGPAVGKWYQILNHYMPGTGNQLAIRKMLADQLVFAPAFLALVMSIVQASEGKNKEEIAEYMKNNYPDVLVSNYMVWPFFQYVNFRFVPFHYQLMANQSVSILWNTYLSWRLFDEEAKARK